jgi:hypothetical protein
LTLSDADGVFQTVIFVQFIEDMGNRIVRGAFTE